MTRASGTTRSRTLAEESTPGSPAPVSLTADDVTRTLNSLADLRDRGAISTEEFERKKAELLGRL